jgi:hypothetical protein
VPEFLTPLSVTINGNLILNVFKYSIREAEQPWPVISFWADLNDEICILQFCSLRYFVESYNIKATLQQKCHKLKYFINVQLTRLAGNIE